MGVYYIRKLQSSLQISACILYTSAYYTRDFMVQHFLSATALSNTWNT